MNLTFFNSIIEIFIKIINELIFNLIIEIDINMTIINNLSINNLSLIK